MISNITTITIAVTTTMSSSITTSSKTYKPHTAHCSSPNNYFCNAYRSKLEYAEVVLNVKENKKSSNNCFNVVKLYSFLSQVQIVYVKCIYTIT
jgi:hypothetical protein